MLQNLLDPRCEKALQESDLRVVLRLTRTIIWHFHSQLRSKCSIFIDALLSGKTLPPAQIFDAPDITGPHACKKVLLRKLSLLSSPE